MEIKEINPIDDYNEELIPKQKFCTKPKLLLLILLISIIILAIYIFIIISHIKNKKKKIKLSRYLQNQKM